MLRCVIGSAARLDEARRNGVGSGGKLSGPDAPDTAPRLKGTLGGCDAATSDAAAFRCRGET